MNRTRSGSRIATTLWIVAALIGTADLTYGQTYAGGYSGFLGMGLTNKPYCGPVWYNHKGYTSPRSYPIYAAPQYSPVPQSMPPAPAGEIVLFAPADGPEAISYSLNGQTYSLKPGESQRITNDRPWIIEFSRGNGRAIEPAPGSAPTVLRYSLSTGSYKFRSSTNGIELFQSPDAPNMLPPSPALQQ